VMRFWLRHDHQAAYGSNAAAKPGGGLYDTRPSDRQKSVRGHVRRRRRVGLHPRAGGLHQACASLTHGTPDRCCL
jgi:hypothetical protein